MKIRTDFVTNSSSSSFIGIKIRNKEILKLLEGTGLDGFIIDTENETDFLVTPELEEFYKNYLDPDDLLISFMQYLKEKFQIEVTRDDVTEEYISTRYGESGYLEGGIMADYTITTVSEGTGPDCHKIEFNSAIDISEGALKDIPTIKKNIDIFMNSYNVDNKTTAQVVNAYILALDKQGRSVKEIMEIFKRYHITEEHVNKVLAGVPTRGAGSLLSSGKAISVGLSHSLVLLENGDVYSFGGGKYGQLGHGDSENRLLPSRIETLSGAKAISTGNVYSLVLLENGDVYSFGDGEYGQLGHGDSENRLLPRRIETLSGVKAISAGGSYSLVLLENGDVYSFGHGNRGQLGHGDLKDRMMPTKIETLANAKKISAGSRHSLVLLENGDVYAFGVGENFQLGQGDNKDRLVPTKIESLTDVKEISAGESHSLALMENGDVYSFGDGEQGALGQGNENEYREPTKIASVAGASAIAAGDQVSIILLENGQVYSCGETALGTSGHEGYENQLVPRKIEGISDAIAISTCNLHSMILLNNGEIYSFGFGMDGTLGHGDEEERHIPKRIECLPRAAEKRSNGMLVHGVVRESDPLQPLCQLTFARGKIITVGNLDVTIPDGIEFVSEDEDSRGELLEGVLFQAVSEDYGKSSKEYQDAPIGIVIRRSEGYYSYMMRHMETEVEADRFLREMLNDSVKNEEFEGTYKLVKYQKNMAIAYMKAGEGDENDTDYWSSYVFVIFHESALYSGMVYFNSLKASEAEYDQVLSDFLSRIMPGQGDAQDKDMVEKLGKYAGGKNKIDAIWVTQLFSKDFVFYNDDDVGFDGTHHYVLGMQFNLLRFYEEPIIENNSRLIASCITDLVTYVEKNENLMIPLEYVHDVIADLSWSQPITGMSLFNLCAQHMIKIRVDDTKENSYMVVLDVNILKGIPHASLYIAEFIKTLREYNGIEGSFEVKYLKTRLLHEDYEVIDDTVRGAVGLTTDEIIKIDAGQEPYAGVIEGIA